MWTFSVSKVEGESACVWGIKSKASFEYISKLNICIKRFGKLERRYGMKDNFPPKNRNIYMNDEKIECRHGMKENLPPKNRHICMNDEKIECRHGMKENLPPKNRNIRI